MKKIAIIVMTFSLSILQLNRQENFRDFIESFPKYKEWKGLPDDIRDITVPDKTLDADKVNRFIYTDRWYKGARMPAGNGRTEKPPPNILLLS
jgi:hypothetical protein